MRIRGLVCGMLSKAKHFFCRKFIIERQAGLSEWRGQAKEVSRMMSVKFKGCDLQPVFCRLQQEVAFQALEGSSTGKTGERVKEKADKKCQTLGIAKGCSYAKKGVKVENKEPLFGPGSDCEAVEGWSHKGNVFEG